MTYVVVSEMSGRRIAHGGLSPGPPKPLGVLATQARPASPEVADLVGKVIGSGLPQLVDMVHEARDAAPRLVNTDHDPLCLVKATVHVADTDAATQQLTAHPDVETRR